MFTTMFTNKFQMLGNMIVKYYIRLYKQKIIYNIDIFNLIINYR